MIEKVIIFDASTLITLAMNGLLKEFSELKRIFKGRFLIPEEVKKEVIDKPITVKRFELEALKLKQLFDENILELPSALGIKQKEILEKTIKIMNIANETFSAKGKSLHLLHSGEAACLALSQILNEKKILNILAVDERTLRMLGEKPKNLEKLMGKKLHTQITSRKENFKFFGGFRFIRSSELVYLIYKKGIVKLKDPRILDALLYAVKFKGCSISDIEIDEIKRIK